MNLRNEQIKIQNVDAPYHEDADFDNRFDSEQNYGSHNSKDLLKLGLNDHELMLIPDGGEVDNPQEKKKEKKQNDRKSKAKSHNNFKV